MASATSSCGPVDWMKKSDSPKAGLVTVKSHQITPSIIKLSPTHLPTPPSLSKVKEPEGIPVASAESIKNVPLQELVKEYEHVKPPGSIKVYGNTVVVLPKSFSQDEYKALLEKCIDAQCLLASYA